MPTLLPIIVPLELMSPLAVMCPMNRCLSLTELPINEFPVLVRLVKEPSNVMLDCTAVPIVPTIEFPVIVPLELMFPLAVMCPSPITTCASVFPA